MSSGEFYRVSIFTYRLLQCAVGKMLIGVFLQFFESLLGILVILAFLFRCIG